MFFIESWKNSLIDMSGRNTLLYFKFETQKGEIKKNFLNLINFNDELLNKLLGGEAVSLNDESIETQLDKKKKIEPDKSSKKEYKQLAKIYHPDNRETGDEEQFKKLQASFNIEKDEQATEIKQSKDTFAERKKLLDKLRLKDKTAEEDLGTNILYLTYGLLHWTEPNRTGSVNGNQENTSPLFMIPLDIIKKGGLEPKYSITLDEDEAIVFNPALRVYLKQSFDINFDFIPEKIENEEINLQIFNPYLESIEAGVSKNKWRVDKQVKTIATFGFANLSMYKEMEEWGEEMSKHSLLSSLTTKEPYSQEPIRDAFTIDTTIHANESHCVVDADSSQIEAIQAAKDGRSFVLDGPPGTGKSQTIVNIIAELISQGKKVLFVSQKKAALDVVKSRLDACSLGSFCLDLHNHQTKSKEFIDRLDTSFNHLISEQTSLSEQKQNNHFKALEENRKELNIYANKLKEKFGKLDKTIFELYAINSSSESIKDIQFTINNVIDFDELKLDKVKKLLNNLESLQSIYSILDSHPWKHLNKLEFIGFQEKEILHSKLDQTLSKVNDFNVILAKLYKLTGYSPQTNSFNEFYKLIETLLLLEQNVVVSKNWLDFNSYTNVIEELYINQNEHLKLKELKNNIESFTIPNSLRERDIDEIIEQITKFIKPEFLELETQEGCLFHFIAKSISITQNLLDAISRTYQAVEYLPRDKTLTEFSSLYPEFKLFMENHNIQQKWLDIENYSNAIEQCSADKNEHGILQSYKDKIECYTEPSRLNKEYVEELFFQLNKYIKAGILGNLFFQFSTIKKTLINDFYNPNMPLPSVINIQQDLLECKNFLLYNEKIESKAQSLNWLYGDHYVGLQTDWNAILQTLMWLKQTSEGSFGLNKSTKNLIISIESKTTFLNDINLITDLIDVVKNHYSNLFDMVLSRYWIKLDLAKILELLHERIEPFNNLRSKFYKTNKPLPKLENIKEDLHLFKSFLQLQNNINEKKQYLKSRYEDFYNDLETDWEGILTSFSWLNKISNSNLGLNQSIKELLSDTFKKKEFIDILNKTRSLENEINQLIDENFTNFLALGNWSNLPLIDLIEIFREKLSSFDMIDEWIRLCQIKAKLQEEGLPNFIEKIQKIDLETVHLEQLFEKRFYRLYLDEIEKVNPLLSSFSSVEHARTIKDFQQLDQNQFSLNQERVFYKLKSILKQEYASHKNLQGQLKELQVLAGQKRPKRKIRQIVRELRDLILLICPCWMMSPLSVSQFIELTKGEDFTLFDTVVFDEASQIFPHDAVCSIFRGKQLIVAGDPKQMPPTNIGLSLASSSDEDDEEELPEFESILDLVASSLNTNRRLRWHYRSKYEELINPSNSYIYNGDLITFPQPEVPDRRPIEISYVENGIFDKKQNQIEANKLIDKLIEVFRDNKSKGLNKSLGIITMGRGQQDCICECLQERLRMYPDLVEFLDDEKTDGLFIKNLETVQGDERDIIFLSIGYGKNIEGKFFQRFGPINQAVGYRRLNVAFTRAKEKVYIFCSFHFFDLTIKETSSKGIQFLQSYLKYAETGEIDTNIINNYEKCESPLEQQIMKALQGLGYDVRSQIGCSSYRIDLGILHPIKKDEFILGVECDGAMYHSAPTARERDRLRQQILENRGWVIHRIWSQDWWRNKNNEIEKVKRLVEQYT